MKERKGKMENKVRKRKERRGKRDKWMRVKKERKGKGNEGEKEMGKRDKY